MNKIIFSFTLFFCLFFFTDRVAAKTIYVGNGEIHRTISAGISAASSGDTVIIKNGTYKEEVNIGKSITLRAENKHGATIDGDYNLPSGPYADPVSDVGLRFKWESLVDIAASNVTMEGFVITESAGRAVRVWKSGYAAMNNITIKDNKIVDHRLL